MGAARPSAKKSVGQSPAGSCICKSGVGVTFRIIQMAAYLGRKANISIGSSGGHDHDLLWD